MKSTAKPIRSTIIWGLISGLLYIPLCIALSRFMLWPVSFQVSLWMLLAGYGVLLSRWTPESLRSVSLPLLLLMPIPVLRSKSPCQWETWVLTPKPVQPLALKFNLMIMTATLVMPRENGGPAATIPGKSRKFGDLLYSKATALLLKIQHQRLRLNLSWHKTIRIHSTRQQPSAMPFTKLALLN